MKGRSGPSIKLSLGICSSYNNKSSCSDTDSDNSLYSPSDQNKDKRGRSGIEREEIDDGGGGGGGSRNTSNGGVIEQQKKLSGCFTRLQLQQLSLQFFIFKCFASGLPLPLHILLSFWNSVAPTPGPPPPVPPSVPWTLPSAVERFRLLDMETRTDPEPGRCRRTDGKKWRCSKEVVPNQKYCEKHMHRGAGRSRKLVEASKPGRLINLNTPHPPHPADADSGFSIAPASPARPARSRPFGGPCAEESTVKRFKDGGSGMTPANDDVKTGNSDGGDAAAAAIGSHQAEGYIINNENPPPPPPPPPPRTGQAKGGCSGTKIVFKSSVLARNNKGGVGRASTGLDFSPKSVLQGGATLKDR